MFGLVPFNKRNIVRSRSGYDNLYNMLDDFFSEPLSTGRDLRNDTFKLDIEEKEDKYVIEAELPGIKKEEVNLELNDGRLVISVEREEKKEIEEKNYLHKERRYSSMSRSVYLGDIQEEEISAKLEDGVLCIKLPKQEVIEKSKKIPIE